MTDQLQTSQVSLFDEQDAFEAFFDDDTEAFLLDLFEGGGTGLDYEEQPMLLIDTDPDRVIARQKEMMDTVFGGIGEERKEEKRMGLATQHLDIEQRHALRLLLIFQDSAELARHLNRCLVDVEYGYGERGDQGRTIAQSMAALSEDKADVTEIAAAWLESHRGFQQSVHTGTPFSFRSTFDDADLDTFVPQVQKTGDNVWRLGVEGEGKYQDFQGAMETVWPKLADAYVEWSEADNAQWLDSLKKKAAKQTQDSIFRLARADLLRRERDAVTLNGSEVTLSTTKESEGWPRTIAMYDAEGAPLLGLSRLSGHNFYEVSWNGGFNSRLFEISGTSRKNVPIEHIELALLLAETLGAEQGLTPEPITANDVEAACLRRMKADSARLGPPALNRESLPKSISGKPLATYTAGQAVATLLTGGGDDLAYITLTDDDSQAILLRRNPKKGVLMALPVIRGRAARNQPLMTTPLDEIEPSTPDTNRAILAWGCWLLWAVAVKTQKKQPKRQEKTPSRESRREARRNEARSRRRRGGA